MSERVIVWARFPLHLKKTRIPQDIEVMRWYHRLFYAIPIVQDLGLYQMRRGHHRGASWGLEEGHRLAGNPKKMSQRKIARAMKGAGVKAP